MIIRALDISELRLFGHLHLEPVPGINYIVGRNGSGKTSVLEAIYLAGRGRSFRHADAGPLIREGSPAATVVVKLDGPGAGQVSTLGIRRERSAIVCRLNGLDVRKRSVLAETLQVLFIGSQPQMLLEMGPELRRRFLDLALFHVEHAYLNRLAEYQRILRQRNAAVRNADRNQVSPWDAPLIAAAQAIDDERQAISAELAERTMERLCSWGQQLDLSFRYRRGWSDKGCLADQLAERLDADISQGFTGLGPHRADLVIKASHATAAKQLSRGQQKLVVFALNLAVVDAVRNRGVAPPIVLVDDLAAELDADNRRILVEALRYCGSQVFVTAIEPPSGVEHQADLKVFHVEQSPPK